MAMYAVVGSSDIDLERTEEAESVVRDQLIPRISQAPGFVSATFTRSAEGKGHSMVVFDSEEAAQAVGANAAGMLPADGPITLLSIEVCQVTGSA